jgi:hypothetical protein
VVAKSPLPDELAAEALFHDSLAVLTSAGSADTPAQVTLAELAHEPWVQLPADSLFGSLVVEVFRVNGYEPPRSTVVTYSEYLKNEGPLSHFASELRAEGPPMAPLAQGAAGCIAAHARADRAYHPKKSDAHAARAALHRARPRGRQADGAIAVNSRKQRKSGHHAKDVA